MAINRNPWHSSPKYFRNSISGLSRWKYLRFFLLTIQSQYALIPVILSKKAPVNKRPEVPSAFIPHLISIWKANSWNGINALNPFTFIRRLAHGDPPQIRLTLLLTGERSSVGENQIQTQQEAARRVYGCLRFWPASREIFSQISTFSKNDCQDCRFQTKTMLR